MQSVIETGTYLAHAKGAGVGDDERRAIVDMVAADPTIGEIMESTGGARKVRFARAGGGKSGGYRVITFSLAPTCRCSFSTCTARDKRRT